MTILRMCGSLYVKTDGSGAPKLTTLYRLIAYYLLYCLYTTARPDRLTTMVRLGR